MDRKFFIILFATIFYNGVTYSSPVEGQQISNPRLPEEKPTAVQQPAVDVNKKIEPTPVPAAKPSVPVAENPKQSPAEQLPTVKNETIHSTTQNSTVIPPHVIDSKNSTEANKTNTEVVDNKNQKTNATQGTDSKDAVHPVPINGTVPANSSIPVPAGSNSTNGSSTTTGAPTTTTTTTTPAATTMKPTVKPAVSTVTPSTTSKDNIISGPNTPAPAQEKHFDGASFVGGIVLTIGLTAIGFIAFKYYKSGKIDMNYRTL